MENLRRKVLLPVKNIDAALRAYYGTGYINNKDIRDIFGIEAKGNTTVSQMKKQVSEEEARRNIPIIIPHHVNVKVAFEVWGIDIKELEKNRKRLMELNLS